MLFAVRFYSQFPNDAESIAGIPGQWPHDLLDITGTGVPPDATWTVMDDKQYTAYRDKLQPLYDQWKAGLDAVQTALDTEQNQGASAIFTCSQVLKAISTIATPFAAQEAELFVRTAASVLSLLNLGLPKPALLVLQAIPPGTKILDANYDPKNPSITNSQYLQSLIKQCGG